MSNNKYKVLVIEDEPNIRSVIDTILQTNGYQVILAKTCQEGIMMHMSYVPDLVILDLGLPDRDGLEFIENARQSSAVPILVLSARMGERDKVKALDLGANDYITKPFGTEEFLARVRAALRSRRTSTNTEGAPKSIFTLQDLTIDYDRRIVIIAGKEVKLTRTEFNILALLSDHSGKVMTYAAIMKEIWGDEDSGGIKKLQVNMANLRKKLGSKPGDNRYIINELGVGYRMSE